MSSPASSSAFGALVTRVAAGDRAALRILYNVLCEPIGDQIRRGLPFPEDVRAVVDATFVEVWWMARFHIGAVADADILGWVLQVARRRAAERLQVVTRDEGPAVILHQLLRPAAPVPGFQRRN